jgi:glycosyltransferase involved in cell wall biosynthesis
MKLLFITPTLPDRPDKDGMTQVAFRLLGELTQRHAITVWSLGESTESTAATLALGVRSVRIFQARTRSLISYYLFGSRFPYYQTRHESKALHIALQTLQAGDFDLVIVHSPFMGQYTLDIQHTPVVIHAMDAMSTWFTKTAEHEWRVWKKIHFQNEARRAQHVEHSQYRQARAVTFVSPTDEQTIQKLLPRTVTTASIPIGITLGQFYPPASERLPATVLFSGVMNYPPNVDAVQWFCREVWPSIRSRFPDAIFRIVGKDPSPTVRSLQSIPGVDIAGRVERISDELRSATVAVSPLRFGTGFKIKAIEALACGAPLIASPETMHGYDLVPGQDVIVADDAESWIIALTDLLRRPQRRIELGQHGVAAAQRYAWPVIARRYEALYDTLIHG